MRTIEALWVGDGGEAKRNIYLLGRKYLGKMTT